jgi:hypothetical protein
MASVTLSPRTTGYAGGVQSGTDWRHTMKILAFNAQLRTWVRRYLLAEVLSTLCALLAAGGVYALSRQALAAAFANTAAGSLSFYAVMLGREVLGRSVRDLPLVVRDLLLEFGPAEALDTLLLRPGLLYAGMTFAPNPALGVLLGKLAADICFYAPAIISHELLRRSGRATGSPVTAAKPLYSNDGRVARNLTAPLPDDEQASAWRRTARAEYQLGCHSG